ncbi:proline-rich protein [Pholiota molesta]|nr:proline-rich protein [Pholiota molesta]
MWVISAPFDAEAPKGEDGRLDFLKSKLLKPNTSYILGRKERALVINNKRISQDHCEFVVGDHTIDDMSDPSTKPVLEVVNIYKKERRLTVKRAGRKIKVEAFQKLQLHHEDVVEPVQGLELKIEWKPICVYSPVARGKGSIPADACAALGIKLMYTQHANTTHHLISHYVANLSTATSLLSLTRFVKPEWLQEVIRLGSIPVNDKDADGISLEQHFILPSESKYRPAFSPSLLPSHKKFGVWEANEARVNFFSSCRFVCLREKIRESDSELQEAIRRGEGAFENFDIHSGVTKFHRTLTRGHAKEGKKVVVVADADLMQAAVGEQSWREYISEAKSFNLEILPPSQVVQAVLEANIDLLFPSVSTDADSNAGSSRILSPLPDVVPNSISDEPSITPEESESQASRRPTRLVRRVARSVSREPSQPPTVEPEKVDEPAPSRPRRLIRRVITGPPIITGLDDPSSVIDAVPDLPPRNATPPREGYNSTAPTPARSTRLKRRVGVAAPEDQASSMLSGIAETMEEEPPLKKFKALFDASHPDGAEYDSLAPASQTQSDALSQTLRRIDASSPAAFREEEEEEGTQSGVRMPESQRVQKRRLDSLTEDVEMEDAEPTLAPTAAQPSKRRAIEDVNAVERDHAAAPQPTTKPPSTLAPSTKNQGAPTGKPDTDAAFLKAIASTKRGKKAEDVFDREFNQLKISKPEIETRREPEEEWGVLAEFGDDSGLRGNFMTIVEMDLYRKDLHQKPPPNQSWGEKPNFKKFKKKGTGISRAKVDVYPSDENDYGMGSAYWKNGNSQAPGQTQNTVFGSQAQSQANGAILDSQDDFETQPRSRAVLDDDDFNSQPVPRQSRQPPSRKGSAAPKRAATRSKQAAKPVSALFLDSDDDVQIIEEEEQEERVQDVDPDESSTLRSTAQRDPSPKRPTRSSKSKAKVAKPVIIDDDSDDGIVFKGFKGRKGKH